MKIAQITATFPPYYGGTGSVCLGQSLYLSKMGQEVTVFTSSALKLEYEESVKGVDVRRLDPYFRIGNAPFLPQLRNLKDFDIVHLHYPFVFGAEWVKIAESRNKFPLIVNYHQDLQFTGILRFFQSIYDATVKARIINRAEKIFVPNLDYTVNTSLARSFNESPQRFVEIPNGVDTQRFSPGPRPDYLKKRYLIDEDYVIVFVGALDKPHKFKGVEVLLKSFSRMEKRARLVIVGDGNLRNSYELLSRNLGVSNRTTFVGRVADSELPDHYRFADLVVLPSTTTEEISGVVLIEAMACEKPVVASDLPGVRRVFENGKSGLLVPPSNNAQLSATLDWFASSDTQSRLMGVEGRRKAVSSYDWNIIGAAILREYHNVIDNQ